MKIKVEYEIKIKRNVKEIKRITFIEVRSSL